MTATLDVLVDRVDRISRCLAYLGGTMLLLIVAVIALEIVLRRVFAVTLGLGFEMSGYVLAISSSWAFAYALFRKAHIRIDAAYVQVGQRARVALDILALAAFVAFAVVVCEAAGSVVLESVSRNSLSNTPLQTPLWIPQALWLAGLAWFAFATVVLLLRIAAATVSGDFETVQRLAGSPTLDEKV
jgi:TRAP-type mannitol/chloroaromatic compound transport system permease small subunit